MRHTDNRFHPQPIVDTRHIISHKFTMHKVYTAPAERPISWQQMPPALQWPFSAVHREDCELNLAIRCRALGAQESTQVRA